MTTPHANLTGANLHEPKGVATATAQHVYIANGSGSGNWQLHSPYGGLRYADFTTGTTFTAPTAYTLINVVSSATNLNSFTQNSLGRLTYTGSTTRVFKVTVNCVVKHSVGSADTYFSIYKNGAATSPAAETVVRVAGTDFVLVSFDTDVSLVQNDYLEVFTKVASGNTVVHSLYMFAEGFPA